MSGNHNLALLSSDPIVTAGGRASLAFHRKWQELIRDYVGSTVSAIVTDNYTVGSGESIIPVDATDGAITVTLPHVSLKGQFTVKKIDSSANAVVVTGAHQIDGEDSWTLDTQYQALTVTAGASEWHVI